MTRILIGGNCTTGGSPIVRTAESPVPWLMIPRIDLIELTSGGAAQLRVSGFSRTVTSVVSGFSRTRSG